MRTVYIERKSSILGCVNVYMIFCDEKLVGSVRNGQNVSFEIDGGEHVVQCRVTTPVYFNENGGGGGTKVSDVVRIPSGDGNIHLIASPSFASIKLEMK